MFNDVIPNLTLLRETDEADELTELTESMLPLRSRDRPPPYLDMDPRLWGVADGGGAAEGGTLPPAPALVTLWTGANNPCMGLQSKYLQTNKV